MSRWKKLRMFGHEDVTGLGALQFWFSTKTLLGLWNESKLDERTTEDLKTIQNISKETSRKETIC